jgi:hypothetical protein
MRMWLRNTKNLNEPEEELIHIYEPETEINLSDEEERRSYEDLINCQVGENGLSSCQVVNGKRPSGDLEYFMGSSAKSSNFQVGNEMGSVDLIDRQVGSREFPNCQVEKEKDMRLSENLRSLEVSSFQREMSIGENSCGYPDHVNEDDEELNTSIIKEEDQRSILIIGGIKIFLPNRQVEDGAHDKSVAEEERKPA